MQTKYDNWCSGGERCLNRNSSFIWEICLRTPDVVGHMSWILGDGMSIGLLHDTWMANLPLKCWLTFISIDIDD